MNLTMNWRIFLLGYLLQLSVCVALSQNTTEEDSNQGTEEAPKAEAFFSFGTSDRFYSRRGSFPPRRPLPVSSGFINSPRLFPPNVPFRGPYMGSRNTMDRFRDFDAQPSRNSKRGFLPRHDMMEHVDFVEDVDAYQGEEAGSLQAALNVLWKQRNEAYADLEDSSLLTQKSELGIAFDDPGSELSSFHPARSQPNRFPPKRKPQQGHLGYPTVHVSRPAIQGEHSSLKPTLLRPQYTPTRHQPGLEALNEGAGASRPSWVPPHRSFGPDRWRPNRMRRNGKLQMIERRNSDEAAQFLEDDFEIIYGTTDPEQKHGTAYAKSQPSVADPNRIGFPSQLMNPPDDALSQVTNAVGGLSDSLPPLETAVTVMSFVAFSVFVANLFLQSLSNNSYSLNVLGREEFPALEDLDLAAALNGSSLLEVLSDWSPEGVLGGVFGLAGSFFSDLTDVAKNGVTSIRKVLGVTEGNAEEQTLTSEGGSSSPLFERLLNTSSSGEESQHKKTLEVECLKRIFCHGQQLLDRTTTGRYLSVKLLPFWTFGLSWLKGDTPTPRLLEDMRARVAGLSQADCGLLYPECTSLSSVRNVIRQIQWELHRRQGRDDDSSGGGDNATLALSPKSLPLVVEGRMVEGEADYGKGGVR